jgi:hypothetical protein
VSRAASRWLFQIALYFFQTIVTFLAVWTARLEGQALLLPAVVLAGWLFAALVTFGASRALSHEPPQRGAFIMVGCMSNHGFTLLGIVALMLFGEQGLAQATYGQLFFIPFFVLFCFPVARAYGNGSDETRGMRRFAAMVWDGRNLPLVAMALGIALNVAGVPRPDVARPVLAALVYGGTVVSGLAVGLQLRRSTRSYLKENVYSFVFRCTLYPAFFLLLAMLLGLNQLDTRILVLYGLVPSALLSNLVADLFGLDTDLTNSAFVTSTILFLAVVLPAYALLAAPL